MPAHFEFDVFLSHNAMDKAKVRRLAERLKAAGLRVWFDEWIIRPGDDIFLAIERGLESSRTMILCLSANAVNSGWVSAERSTVLFRDPTNAGRRFVPVLLSECTLPATLHRYAHVDFRDESDTAFAQLLAACREPGDLPTTTPAAPPSLPPVTRATEASPPEGPKGTSSENSKRVDIAGHWTATLCKEGQAPCQVYLTLEVMDDLLFGTVSYPTGNAGILDGKISGDTISFLTRHVPNWSTEEATTKWVAKIVGQELRGFIQNQDGPGKFTAERSAEPRRYGWTAGTPGPSNS